MNKYKKIVEPLCSAHNVVEEIIKMYNVSFTTLFPNIPNPLLPLSALQYFFFTKGYL